MSGRIATMRQTLFDKLSVDTTVNWDHIIKQIGMFAYTVNQLINYIIGIY